MPRWPQNLGVKRDTVISTPHLCAPYFREFSVMRNDGWASATWPLANQAIFVPFELDRPMRVTSAWWVNGNALASASADIGVYTADGTKLYSSGAVVLAGTNAYQTTGLGLPLTLPRGALYLALAVSSVSAQMYVYNPSNIGSDFACFMLGQASAFPLPAVATFAAYATQRVPYCGLTGRTF